MLAWQLVQDEHGNAYWRAITPVCLDDDDTDDDAAVFTMDGDDEGGIAVVDCHAFYIRKVEVFEVSTANRPTVAFKSLEEAAQHAQKWLDEARNDDGKENP